MPGYDYLFNNTGPTGQNEIMPSAGNPMTNLMPQQAGIFEGPNSYDNNSAPMINQGNSYRLSSNRQPGVDIGNDNNSAPMINQGNPYRLSSNRQPGVDIGNDMYSPSQEGGIMRGFQNYLDKNNRGLLPPYYLDENRSDKLREYMDRGLLPRGNGIETLEANVDPSDWRVIQQIMGAGGNPDDYIETAGLGSDIYNYLDELLDFEGMKNQIPYFLDNTIPFYDPPEGYYDEDYEENLEMA